MKEETIKHMTTLNIPGKNPRTVLELIDLKSILFSSTV